MKKILLALLLPLCVFSQGYTSYFTGNATDVTSVTEPGVCMMGGATEHDNAMRWLLEKANGGDIVVLRSSGSNGYNDYLYSELGVTVNSVETLVITSAAGATNPYVLSKVANAEMIWFAGGDQFDYVSYFKDNALEDLINAHINVKHAPIGGTSAGMAILGGKYFSAANGSVTSAEALANPYNQYMALGADDFVNIPIMSDVITDTHYDNPDRRGRQFAFIARFRHDSGSRVKGIACNEYVAVCIGDDGIAHVYGDYPNYQEFAYFIQENCQNTSDVEMCMAGMPLTWNQQGKALKVYKVPGTMTGTHYFDMNNWQAGSNSGGSWQDWAVVDGALNAVDGTVINCLLQTADFDGNQVSAFPNPFNDAININAQGKFAVSVYDLMGRKMLSANGNDQLHIDTVNIPAGLYFLNISNAAGSYVRKMIRN